MQNMTKERIEEERETVALQLNLAVETYYKNPVKQTFEDMCEAFTLGLVYNVAIIVPTDIKNDQPMYRLRNMNPYETNYRGCDRFSYIAYTSFEEAVKTPSKLCSIVGIRPFFYRVDKHPGILGLLLNPERSAKNKSMIFLNKENIHNIVTYCNETIKSQNGQYLQFLIELNIPEHFYTIKEMQEILNNTDE